MHLPLHPNLDFPLPAAPPEKLQWWFRFRAADGRQSFRFTKAIANLFPFQTSTGESIGEKPGTVIVSIVLDGPLSPRKAKKTLTDSTVLAREHGLTFLGVGCRIPGIDWSSIKWLTLDDAKWRLRHFADTGQLAKGQAGRTDFLFAFQGTAEILSTLDRDLSARGLRTKSVSLDPAPLLLTRITSNPTDADLTTHFTQMQQSAAAAGAQLKGVDLWSLDADW